jgi:hypothetical protein
LAGAIGGAAGLAGGAGLWSLRSAEPSGGPNDLPYLLGKAEPSIPHGVVRADLRAFKQGSGSDYHQAFDDALKAADAVYVPPGHWMTEGTIEVPAGKALWSDGGFDNQDASQVGAVIESATSMQATVRMTGPAAMLSGVNVDGSGKADAAVEFAADSLLLERVSAKRGKSYALKATGNFCTIWGGLFQQLSNEGNAVFYQGSDLILWGARIKRGAVPLLVGGSGGILGLLHVTGKTERGSASTAVVRVTGPRNQFVNVFYDSSAGPSLLLENGGSHNRFVGMTIRNSGSDGSFPVIRCDASGGPVRNNRFDAFHTDQGQGSGWSFLLELLGPSLALSGTELGSGHADGCKQLWNARPALVGDVASDGKLSRNAGTADLGAGQRRLVIAHGLKGRPRAIGVTPSKGQSSPDVTVSDTQLVLAWTSNPGPLSVSWTAEL